MKTARRNANDARPPRRRSRHLLGLAVGLLGWAAVTSCGSRTGLFVPDPGPDAQIRVDRAAPPIPDAQAEDVADVSEEPLPCIPGTFTFRLASPQLMFVVDRSGSMDYALGSDTSPGPGEQSRWRALASALSQTITPFSDQIAMGARFFPVYNSLLSCGQDPPSNAILPALGNAPAILDVFATTAPLGATPTADALEQAALEVSSSRAVARAMVVATDGAPNCNEQLDKNTCVCTSGPPCQTNDACLDDARTVKTIAGIFETRKIPVYVIGIGAATGTFARTLDAMAVAGGRPRTATPRYYPADTPGALTGAFTVIRDSVGKCSYITPSSPQDPDAVSVVVDGKNIPRDPSHVDGWDWIDQAFGHLQLFGTACDAATPTNVSGTVTCD